MNEKYLLKFWGTKAYFNLSPLSCAFHKFSINLLIMMVLSLSWVYNLYLFSSKRLFVITQNLELFECRFNFILQLFLFYFLREYDIFTSINQVDETINVPIIKTAPLRFNGTIIICVRTTKVIS